MAINFSLRLALLLLLSHGVAIIVVCMTIMPQPIRLATLLLVLLSLFYYLARDVLLLLPGSWRKITLENHSRLDLFQEGDGVISSSPACGVTSDLATLLPVRMASGFIGGWRSGSGGISVVTRSGSGFSGKVLHRTVVLPYFAVLHVWPEGRCLPVFRIIFPDALDAGAFRELCVRLKFDRKPAQ